MNRYRLYAQEDDAPMEEGDTGFTGVNSFDTLDSLQPGECQAAVNMDFTTQTAITRGGFVCVPSLGTSPIGNYWTGRVISSGVARNAVCFGNNLFVAVGGAGTTRAMTSPDGINWTVQTTPNQTWVDVVYGGGLFCAIAQSGTGNRIMTSPDGVTWTNRSIAEDNTWQSITYGNGRFVAVSSDGAVGRIAYSYDGLSWSVVRYTSLALKTVTYGDTYGFVAFASGGTGSDAIVSPDGIAWTASTTVAQVVNAVAYGNGLYVAVGNAGTGVQTSPDGVTWTAKTQSTAGGWTNIAFGSGRFLAFNSSSSGIMYSPDGANWTTGTQSVASGVIDICYGLGLYVGIVAPAIPSGSGYIAIITSYAQNIWASGIYSDPNDAGSQWIMVVSTNSVGFYQFGKQTRTVAISGYTVTQQSTVVQCNNLVYIFRGSSSTPLYWDGNWNGSFTIAPTPTPAIGFSVIPNSNQATYYQNRLWVIDGKDTVSASDVLDFTAYDDVANSFNISSGSSDYLVTTFPFGENSLLVFKNKSIYLLQNVQGTLTDVTSTEVTRQVGAIGINSVCSVGSDLVYVSDRNINLLSLTDTNNAVQHQTQPLSRNIQSIIQRVNWNYAYKISMAYWNNAVYIALPLDNATVCNAVVVYNFVTKQWYGEWNFASAINMCILNWAVVKYQGATRLHAVTEDGRIFVALEGQNDISGSTVAEISTSLTTRAFRADNNNKIPRRLYADLGTNRPNYSITAYAEGQGESSTEISNQTYSRSQSWLFGDSTYALNNQNNDFNRAFRKDYSTGPATIQCGASGFLPEAIQYFRLPLLTRRKGRLSWFTITNTTGLIQINGIGVETRRGDRSSLTQVG